MRAKFINERFKEDSDPITDMGIGIFHIRDYDSRDSFYNFLAENILGIVKLEKLPEDFIKVSTDRWQIKKPYAQIIREFINNYVTIHGNHPSLDSVYYISELSRRLDNGVLHVDHFDPDMQF